MIVSHTTTLVTLIVGILTIMGIIGGFGISLLRRWWSLEQWIKVSIEQDKKAKKRDRRLKKDLTRLVEQKLADHVEFDYRLTRMEHQIHAVRKRTARAKLGSQEQGNRPSGRHTRTT